MFNSAFFGSLPSDSFHLMSTYIMRLIYGFINYLGEHTGAVINYNIANSFLIYCAFLGAFAKLRKGLFASSSLIIRPSVCPHGKTREPLDRLT